MKTILTLILLVSLTLGQDIQQDSSMCCESDTIEVELPTIDIEDCYTNDTLLVYEYQVSEKDMDEMVAMENEENKKLESEIDEFVNKELDNIKIPK